MSRIGRLTATISVPSQGDLPLGTLDRVGTAVTDGVPSALSRRFPVDDSDAGTDRPVVLIRRLSVSAAVPATASADEIAERVADRLARAILAAPDEGRVRYLSRAAHIAAFVDALAAGTGDSWVFESFDGVRLLAPLTALRTLAERYAVPVVAVLAALRSSGDLITVLNRAAPAEVNRTWAACLALPHPAVPASVAMAHLGFVAVDDAEWPALPSAEARSLVLAARAAARGVSPGVAVGVGVTMESAAVRERVPETPARLEAPPVPADPASAASKEAGPAVFEAAGGPAFLLLPSFDKVGLGALTAAQRAQVLAVATRTPVDDPAVVLAAGTTADAPPVPIGPVVQQALIDDDRLGAEGLVTYETGGFTVVADAGSGIWLAILDPGEPVAGALITELAARSCTPLQPDDALRARIVADLRFLLPDGSGDTAVALAARAGLGHFARRLGGFGASSLPYLSHRFLTPGGVIADLGESIWVRLPAPPLLVVLALAGLDRTTIEVPWLEPIVTITHEDTG